MAFKQVGTLTVGSEPHKYLPGTDGEAYTRGQALIESSGTLTLCPATTVAQYICQKDVAAATPANQNIPVSVIRETDEISVKSTATVAATLIGSKVTLHTDGLSVTATTTSGVFRIKETDGATTNSSVVGVFEI